jgi:phosphatidylglycerophosphate synthase
MDRRARIWTTSNARSFYRLCAAPVVIWAALSEQRMLFLVLMLVSLASDAIDGFLARRWREETRLGARLDALADSLTLGAGLTGVWVFERTPFIAQPVWLLLFLGALTLATLVTLIRFRRLPAFHLYSFKLADLGLTAFFVAVFVLDFYQWAYVASMSLATFAALEIVAVALVIDRFQPDLKGLWWVLRARR